MKLAFLYAGQGSQHVGMGRDLYENYPAFRAVLDAAPVDFDLKQLCFEGPEEQLNDTRYTQPCMVAFAAGVTAVLKEEGITPAYTAGLSLGEYSALHWASTPPSTVPGCWTPPPPSPWWPSGGRPWPRPWWAAPAAWPRCSSWTGTP